MCYFPLLSYQSLFRIGLLDSKVSCDEQQRAKSRNLGCRFVFRVDKLGLGLVGTGKVRFSNSSRYGRLRRD